VWRSNTGSARLEVHLGQGALTPATPSLCKGASAIEIKSMDPEQILFDVIELLLAAGRLSPVGRGWTIPSYLGQSGVQFIEYSFAIPGPPANGATSPASCFRVRA
jgi:hypothetical protein